MIEHLLCFAVGMACLYLHFKTFQAFYGKTFWLKDSDTEEQDHE